MAKRISYTWLVEHLNGFTPEQLQDWIAGISYVPKGIVPIEICDSAFAYHWYRYLTRVADQFRKRPDEETVKVIFEMLADESDSKARCEILITAHRTDHMKLFPNCRRSDRVIVQRTSRQARIGKLGADGIYDVRLTAYKRAQRIETTKNDLANEQTTSEVSGG